MAYNNKDPTLVVPYFILNSKPVNLPWYKQYGITTFRCILVHKYFFPKSNIVIYMDSFLLNKLKLLDGNDEILNFTKYTNKFDYSDIETENNINMNNHLTKCFELFKNYENVQFNNGLERVLTYFDLACRIMKDTYNLDKISGNFYSYKLEGPFIEKKDGIEYGHITDGYISSYIRYIAIRQQTFIYNGITVNRPCHLVWRDPATTTSGYNDYLLLKKINEISKSNNKELYFPCNNYDFVAWHDYIKCNNKIINKGTLAGYFTCVNFTDSPKFISDEIYKLSFGLGFILNTDNNLIINNHRFAPPIKDSYKFKQAKYHYGIDEYILSSIFNINYYKEKSIYINVNLSSSIDKEIYHSIPYLIITLFIIKNYSLTTTNLSFIDIINYIDKIRNDSNFKIHPNYNELRLLLYLVPSKYNELYTLCSHDMHFLGDYDNPKIRINNKIINYEYLKLIIQNKGYDFSLFENLSMKNLNDLGIYCNKSPYSFLNLCMNNNNNKLSSKFTFCPLADYQSGFYFDNKNLSNISAILSPDDLDSAIKILEENKLINKLNNTNFKLEIETDLFKNAVSNSIDSNNGHILPHLQNIILDDYFVADMDPIVQIIAGNASLIEPDMLTDTQSKIWCPLIWKALNYAGYDVPPEYFINLNFDDDQKYINFNNYVKELSKITGWVNYAVLILINPTIDNNILNDLLSRNFFENSENFLFYNNYKMNSSELVNVEKCSYNIINENTIICIDKIKDIKDIKLKINNVSTLRETLENLKINCFHRENTNSELKDYLLISFSGRTANLGILDRILKFDGNVLGFCDYSNDWYEYMNNILHYCKNHISKINAKKIIIMGTSMGGYAALYLSAYIDCVCFAIAPQTFNCINCIRTNIGTSTYTPVHMKDIRKLINLNKNNSIRYIILSDKWNEDLFFAYHLKSTSNTVICTVNFENNNPRFLNEHVLYSVMSTKPFYNIIKENYNELFNGINYDSIISKIEFKDTYDRTSKKLFYPIVNKYIINKKLLNVIIYTKTIPYEVEMKKLLEKHHNNYNNNINYFFVTFDENQTENIIVENGNTISIKGIDSLLPGVLNKTIIGIDYIVNTLNIEYDYLIKSNISTVVDFNNFPFIEIEKNDVDYIGGKIWKQPINDIINNYEKLYTSEKKIELLNKYTSNENIDFVSGECLILSKNATNYLLVNKNLLDEYIIDDVSIGMLLSPIYTPYLLYNEMLWYGNELPFSITDKIDISIYHKGIKGFIFRNKSTLRTTDIERMNIIIEQLKKDNEYEYEDPYRFTDINYPSIDKNLSYKKKYLKYKQKYLQYRK